jgi:hypothetical protein
MPEFRDCAITTLPELEAAITAAIGRACAAGRQKRATPAFRGNLARSVFADACEVVAAEAERIARPPYRTRRERQQEREAAS